MRKVYAFFWYQNLRKFEKKMWRNRTGLLYRHASDFSPLISLSCHGKFAFLYYAFLNFEQPTEWLLWFRSVLLYHHGPLHTVHVRSFGMHHESLCVYDDMTRNIQGQSSIGIQFTNYNIKVIRVHACTLHELW